MLKRNILFWISMIMYFIVLSGTVVASPISDETEEILIGGDIDDEDAYSLIKNKISSGHSEIIRVDADIITETVQIPSQTEISTGQFLKIIISNERTLMICDDSFELGDGSKIMGNKTSRFIFGGNIIDDSNIYLSVPTDIKDKTLIGNNVTIYADYPVSGAYGADVRYPVFFEAANGNSVFFQKDGVDIGEKIYYPRNEEYSVDESYIRFSDGTSVKANSNSEFVFDYWMVKSLDDMDSIIISSDGLLSKPIQFIAVFKEIYPLESSCEEYEATVLERTYSTEFDEDNGIEDELESSRSLNSIDDVEIDDLISIGGNANYNQEEIISDISNEISTIVLNEDVEEDSVVNEEEIEDIQIIGDVVDKIIPSVLSYNITNDIVDVNSLSSSGETISVFVETDGNLRGLSFSKDGISDFSSTLAGITPTEINGGYALTFLPGDYSDYFGDWNIYVLFDSGEKEFIGTLRIDGETIGSLNLEQNGVETAIPSSPGFGGVSCFVLIGITMVLAYNRTKNG